MTSETVVSVEPAAGVAIETETVETTDNQEAPTAAADAPQELTLEEKYRKAENKIRHDREKIAKARARNERIAGEKAALEAEVTRLRAERDQKTTASQKPKMEDFDSVEDYVDAVATFRAKENNQQAPQEAVLTPQQQQEQVWIAQREAVVAQQAQEFIKTNPDALEVIQDNADLIDDFPQHIKNVLLASDNPTLAVVNLAKEGRLEYLGYLPPEMAALEVRRVLANGGARTAVSKAPAPISTAKGTAPASKTLENKSGKELLKWVNS